MSNAYETDKQAAGDRDRWTWEKVAELENRVREMQIRAARMEGIIEVLLEVNSPKKPEPEWDWWTA